MPQYLTKAFENRPYPDCLKDNLDMVYFVKDMVQV